LEIEKLALSLSDVKSIARSPLWRTYWICNKNSKIFDGCVSDWTDDQRLLYNMSQMYDNVREHPECPDDKVIEDDDMLDGWMIDQRAQQMKNKKIKAFDNKHNTGNAKEVFLFPNNQEEFSEVMSLNDTGGKQTIKERMAFVRNKGKAQEYELPDVQRELQAQLRQLNKR
jgi:hypothetical protein